MPFRKVEARFAGPTALGILVPMGVRTLVVVRPRSLPWDFIPMVWDETASTERQFPVFSRNDAAALARRFQKDLEASASAGQSPVETLSDAADACFQVWIRAAGHLWLACRRAPGQAFEPVRFACRDEAESAALKIESIVAPTADVIQEYYFNTQHFAS